ncbi:asparaginase [Allonocardiopsis opalescens]|uniref:Asparaginase n=1 Tax=Allonocardiopsis opalescens TaxID=1144618 RepID=A0A2T0QAW0_9ACTN|nr:asparaginase [Allonocardiopsis opalescens]PRY00994.1 asparaginase [Allonocardiopsis opalescens]
MSNTAIFHAPLAEVVRNGFTEGVHYGAAVGLAADGGVAFERGPAAAPVLPRSAAKPIQAVASLRAGARLDGVELAVAAGSHMGEPFHVAAVRRILAGAGLSAEALRCPADWPEHRGARDAVVREGGAPSRLTMNCSGKHAAMLAACVASGWSTDDYLRPDHPYQRSVAEATAELAGEPVTATAVDGCGAPLFAVSLTGLARSMRALVLAEPGTPQRAVADAMRAHPEYVAGTGHTVTRLMRALPGVVAKAGAEGVLTAAAPGGVSAAVKVSDGRPRATTLIALRVLAELGVDVSGAAELATVPVRGGGERVGEIRAVV